MGKLTETIPNGEYERRMKAKATHGCMLCAWGNDVADGEYCRACGFSEDRGLRDAFGITPAIRAKANEVKP